jgi:hypothetical protein
MTPKEKALELVYKMFNTENCGIEHFPSKRYCDCSEINMYQAKQCVLTAVEEIIEVIDHTPLADRDYEEYLIEYWQQVREEIINL